MTKVAFYTLGCKLNQYETAVITEIFLKHNFIIVEFNQVADIYIVNSCSVTNRADYKAREFIRKARIINPDAIFIIVGCSIENYPEKFRKLDFVDYLIGTGDKLKFFRENIEHLQKQVKTKLIIEHTPEYNDPGEFSISEFMSHTRAFLKVQDGCNFSCSYCAVRLARGKSRSKPIDSIISEINSFVRNNYKEVVLTGVNLGLYGQEFNQSISFSDLINIILTETGVERVRISSIDPDKIDDNLIKLFTQFPDRLCRHLHISIQSLSDKILKLMRRRNSQDYIMNLIPRLRSTVPEMNIGCDIIVGFPGETESEFETTHQLLNELEINYFHVFPYSKRENTPAAEMKETADGKEKSRRVKLLRKLNQEKLEQFQKHFLNSVLNFLIENRISKSGNLIGLSDNYLSVEFKADSPEKYFNSFQQGEITQLNPLKGKLILNH